LVSYVSVELFIQEHFCANSYSQATLKPNGYIGDLTILRCRGVTRFGTGVLYTIVSSQSQFSLCFALWPVWVLFQTWQSLPLDPALKRHLVSQAEKSAVSYHHAHLINSMWPTGSHTCQCQYKEKYQDRRQNTIITLL